MKGQLTPRQRVNMALSHQEPDRVPIDLGGTSVTGITMVAYRNLVRHLGSPVPEPRLISKIMQLAHTDERIQLRFDADVRPLYMGAPDNWEDIQIDEETYRDQWGWVWRKPPSSFYYDLIESPLAGDITFGDIARYPWPDPTDPGLYRGLKDQVEHWKSRGDYALALTPVFGLADTSQLLRGFEDWYADVALNPGLVAALMDAILEFNLAVMERALELVGDDIDVLEFGDDVTTQSGPMISPSSYRKLVKPRHERLFEFIHSRSRAKIMYHCCGSAYYFMEDFIEIGVDIINPVQVSADDMDTARLKAEFGDRISFWGGIDTQSVLPHGTEAEVREEVERRIADLAPGGGYVLAPVHNIQPDVPPENIVAMCDHAKAVGTYPVRTRAPGKMM